MRWIRSILSIIIGYAAVVGVIITGYTLTEKSAIHHGTPGLLLLTAIACLGGATGGFVAASIAATHRLRHAVILGILMLLLGLALAANSPPQNGEPAWYHWGLAIFALPASVVGGRLRSKT